LKRFPRNFVQIRLRSTASKATLVIARQIASYDKAALMTAII